MIDAKDVSVGQGVKSPSPFLPDSNEQFAWDSTSLGWLKECPRKYQYQMIEGWRSKHESIHLPFGIWYHKGLEDYDKKRAAGLTPATALNEIVHEALIATWNVNGVPGPWVSDHPSKTRETLIRSLIWYVLEFGENDAAKTVTLSNGLPAVELSFRLEMPFNATPDQPYIICGHLDRVAEYAGGIYVMDRKTTTTTISPSYYKQYEPDNQMSLYTFAGKVIYQIPISGVVIDAAQIAVGFTRFARGFTGRTPAQTEEWLQDCKHWFALAKHFAAQNHWPMNDKSCHKYNGCAFRDVCSKSPEVRNRFLETTFMRKPWNPLEVR